MMIPSYRLDCFLVFRVPRGVGEAEVRLLLRSCYVLLRLHYQHKLCFFPHPLNVLELICDASHPKVMAVLQLSWLPDVSASTKRYIEEHLYLIDPLFLLQHLLEFP